jgi:prepilin peptidase CpaA
LFLRRDHQLEAGLGHEIGKALLLGVFLLLAAWWDIRSQRIPNALVLLLWGSGLLIQTLLGPGVGHALLGWGVAMMIFLPAHLLWGMGAGDVKLMAGVGVFLGPEGVFWASLLSWSPAA